MGRRHQLVEGHDCAKRTIESGEGLLDAAQSVPAQDYAGNAQSVLALQPVRPRLAYERWGGGGVEGNKSKLLGSCYDE